MIWQLLEGQDVTPKYIVCGCPKHGLHLLSGMLQGYVQQMPSSIYNVNHWIGTFQMNSFAPVWQDMERWFFIASRLQQGYYYQGHIAYRKDISDYLRLSRVAYVFIYRDLRDVAVSMAYHIIDAPKTGNKHPARAAYLALGGFDKILTACIEGLGPFPGVIGLWELYAKWLEEKWVLSLKYEDVIADVDSAAHKIVSYGLDQITRGIWESKFVAEASERDKVVKQMVALAERKDLSPTFRNGKAGDWKLEFRTHHKELFKQVDKSGWLQRLGYESGGDW